LRAISFIPDDFEPPRELELGDVHLSVLCLDDLDPDYEAVMETGSALHGLFHEGHRWPDGLTRRDDLIDLAWHEKEFERRSSFAWGLWRFDSNRYLGSAYVYPDPGRRATAHAVHWIRSGETDRDLRSRFKAEWEAWVRSWPIPSVRFSPS
jgi:hypothetical protein